MTSKVPADDSQERIATEALHAWAHYVALYVQDPLLKARELRRILRLRASLKLSNRPCEKTEA